eukprot:1151188_1
MLSSVLVLSYAITTVFALGPHDTVSFDLTHFKSDNQLDFDLLGQHYKVQLRRNDNHLPSLFKTSGDIDPLASASLSDDNCYYYGHVLEPHQPDGSYLSLSLCANRGIRGTITLPNTNEQLFILPSAIVTDPQYDREVGIYHLTDPHMVYKDHSESFLPRAQSHGSKGGSRGLLRSSWKNKVELYVLVDAPWTYLFKSKYSSSKWYDELKSYASELIKGASAEYEWWNWGNVGTISLHMVELEIMGEFSGRYSQFKPVFKKVQSNEPDCSNRDWKYNNYNCFNTHTNGYKAIDEFTKFHQGKSADAYLYLTGLDMAGVVGLGKLGTTCSLYASAIIDCKGCKSKGLYYDHLFRQRTTAHEVGHLFGMTHKYPQIGVMGNAPKGGSFVKNGWTDASVRELKAYFSKARGLSCLRDGVRRFKKTDNSAGSPTGGSSGGSTSGGSSGGSSSGSDNCIEIKGIAPSYNGEYKKTGSNKYKKGSYAYLFRQDSKWTINYREQMNSNYVCYKSNVLDCDRKWQVYGETRSGARTMRCGSFTAADYAVDCISNNEYGVAMCVYDFNSTNESTFVLRTDECYTDEVVYEYEDYVLFYNEDYEFNDDEEMRGQWMISQYEIRIVDAIAACDEEDLLQCFEGNWKVKTRNNDTIDMITHATMGVNGGYCASYTGERAHAMGESESETVSLFWITVICVVLIVVLIAVGWLFYRSRAKKAAQSKLDMIADESEGEKEEEDEALEVEAEVEAETNLKQTA